MREGKAATFFRCWGRRKDATTFGKIREGSSKEKTSCSIRDRSHSGASLKELEKERWEMVFPFTGPR